MLVGFRNKEYGGWNIEAKECGIVQSPIGDVDFLSMSSTSNSLGLEGIRKEETDDDDVPLW